MSTSLVMRVMLAATLCVAPAIAGAQAPQTKHCGDGTSSSRSYFACWGHGGVDTTRAMEQSHPAATRHHEPQAVQAGTPRTKTARSTAHAKSKKSASHAKSKASAHHKQVEHHPAHAAKQKSQQSGRGWLPWRHKKTTDHDAKKETKHKKSSKLPVPERPNGEPRSPSQ